VIALTRSLRHGGVAWDSEILAALRRLTSTSMLATDGTLAEEWSAAHRYFHRTLGVACGSPVLLHLVTELYEASQVYRQWSVGLSAVVGAGRPAFQERSRRACPHRHGCCSASGRHGCRADPAPHRHYGRLRSGCAERPRAAGASRRNLPRPVSLAGDRSWPVAPSGLHVASCGLMFRMLLRNEARRKTCDEIVS
jgi:hypothetical protein